MRQTPRRRYKPPEPSGKPPVSAVREFRRSLACEKRRMEGPPTPNACVEGQMSLSRLQQILLVISLITTAACASGSTIVTGTLRPAIVPAEVVLFLVPPADFEVVALVSATSDAGWTEQGSVDYAVAELKKQAARLGANGVLILTTRGSTSTVMIAPGTAIPVASKTVQGQAIFVKKP